MAQKIFVGVRLFMSYKCIAMFSKMLQFLNIALNPYVGQICMTAAWLHAAPYHCPISSTLHAMSCLTFRLCTQAVLIVFFSVSTEKS